ncbi:hypothetical protein VaNZ11_016651 [Volvox africanus]|uniref:Uncharacterized protein n=1 Tax=Volvox africanus TaxID=51714 RepID=A0ABQ5SPZ3_9CHLO|nr:hypothetical protein VaNZ11_016651 [Volvox africanus]
MDSDAARRAAAAEARRQKILARGTERLNRITVGTPLPIDSLNQNVKTDLPEPVAVDSASADADPAPTPCENYQEAASIADTYVIEGVCVQEDSGAANSLASADPMLQQILRGSVVENLQSDEEMQRAYQNAEQALHMLLSQLAGPAGLPYLTPRQASDTDAGAGSNAVSSSCHAEGATSGSTNATEVGQTRSDSSEPGVIGRVKPTSNYTGAGGSSSSRSSGFLLALIGTVVAFLGQLLGPQLAVAMETTRRLRCVAALALAVVLCSHVVEVGHLGLPPLLALLILQVALIAAARVLLLRKSSVAAVAALAAGGVRFTPGVISQSTSGGDVSAAGGGGSGGDDTNAAGAAAAAPTLVLVPTAPPRFDWETLVPGLTPLIDKMYSAHALVSGLLGDLAVFVVSYLVLDAWGHIGGHKSGRS